MKRIVAVVAATVVMGVGAVAHAHEFACEKRVNGQTSIRVTSYPTTLHYTFKVINTHPYDTSIAQSVVDSFLAYFGYHFTPATPFAVPVGGSVSDSYDLTVHGYAECLKYAAMTSTGSSGVITNTLKVAWESGATTCSATVECVPPPITSNVTRTMGFFKTHEQALQQCLDAGSVDLGFITIATLDEALGLLWGSPAVFDSGARRSDLDKYRFLLARQTLVGICNTRLFGSVPQNPMLLEQAVAALAGTSCALISSLISQVDAFNNSGDALAFPSGFAPGPATPQHAQSIADDPTAPSGQSCSP